MRYVIAIDVGNLLKSIASDPDAWGDYVPIVAFDPQGKLPQASKKLWDDIRTFLLYRWSFLQSRFLCS